MATVNSAYDNLLQFGEEMVAPPRSVILDVGDPPEGAYLVTSGRVRLSLVNEDGTPLWSRIVGEGAILGLPSAIAGEPQSMKAVATQPTELTFIEREKLAKLVRDNPAIGFKIVAFLSAEVADVWRKWSMLAVAGKRRS